MKQWSTFLLLIGMTACIGRSLVALPDAGSDAGDASVSDADSGSTELDAGQPDGGRNVSFVYVGSGNGNIYRFKLDEDAGTLTPLGSHAVGGNPSFLTFSSDARFLYTVNENTDRVTALSVDPLTGALSPVNFAGSQGAGPTHVSLDRTGKWILVANYGGGTVAVLPIQPDGGVGPSVNTQSPGANAHFIVTSPDNRFAFVPCLGSNHVAQYAFDAGTGALTPNTPVATAPGAGPRHLAFHPNGSFAYLINEKDSTMTAMSYDAGSGALTPVQTVSTLPAGYADSNTGAEVQVHPSGMAVYGSNRGHNSIVTFDVNPTTGQLTLRGHTRVGADTFGVTNPRHFSLDPSGKWLFVASQTTGVIVAFRVDLSTGALNFSGQVAQNLGTPAFVGVLRVPQP